VKTISLKKVSAVAVASLGFGLLSVVPANAAVAALTAIAVSKNTESPTGTALTAANRTGSTIVSANGISAFKVSAGATVTLNVIPVGDAIATTDDNKIKAVIRGVKNIQNWAVAGANTADGGDLPLTAFTAPTTAGTYIIDITADEDGDPSDPSDQVSATVTMTVVAQPLISASLSTAYQTITTGDAATSTTDKVPARALKTLGTAAVAAITVTLKDTAGDALTTADGYELGATVSGDAGGVAATIHYNATPAFAGKCTGNQPVRVATSATYTAVAQIYFCASNQSGTSTITVTATDADGNVTTIGSETISYYGDVATLEVKPVLSIIRTAGGTTGDNTATRVSTTAPAAMVVTAKDSKGQLVGNLAASLVALGTTGIASVACLEDIYDTGTSGAYGLGGEGNYGCTVTSTGAAASGGTDSVTIRIVDPADAAKFISATAVPVTFGGAPSTVTMAFDKTSYSAGATGTLTVNVKDSAGNNASDGVYATLFSGASTTNVTGTTPGAIVVVIGGKSTSTVFMPNGAGTASVSNTLGATIASKAGAAVSATATVTDGNAALLTQIDALNAKIVALNALIAKIMKRLGVK
jgi:hypothetical protein